MAKTNITTIEGLAEMIQRTMASKEDIKPTFKGYALACPFCPLRAVHSTKG